MTTEQIHTEELIKETAKHLFFQKGHLNATTQEIADQAGVNRALIHYYFRSRDQLFQKVLDETMSSRMDKFAEIFASDATFKNKISRFLDAFIEQYTVYPYLENFLVTEMIRCQISRDYHKDDKKNIKELLGKQLQEEVDAGKIQPITIEHFITNLMSLCNYPLVTKPLIQTIFDLDEAAYQDFIFERKNVVFRTIFNEEPPE